MPESNALGLIAGLIWVVCGLYILMCARRAAVSLRVALGFGLVIGGGIVLELVARGGVDWRGGAVLVVLSLLTLASTITRSGRHAAGLSDWGMTTDAARLDHADDAHEVPR